MRRLSPAPLALSSRRRRTSGKGARSSGQLPATARLRVRRAVGARPQTRGADACVLAKQVEAAGMKADRGRWWRLRLLCWGLLCGPKSR